MRRQWRPALMCLVALSVITGIVYPLLITGVSQVFFKSQANGSLLYLNGKAIGSSLIGQAFEDPRYFWGRPSATGPLPYDGAASSGSNLGPLNPALLEAVEARIKALRKDNPGNNRPIPVDLVTASASGLDPHISAAAADYQVSRVARTRGMSETQVRELVKRHTEGRLLGLLGERVVSVLQLNLALDRLGEQ